MKEPPSGQPGGGFFLRAVGGVRRGRWRDGADAIGVPAFQPDAPDRLAKARFTLPMAW